MTSSERVGPVLAAGSLADAVVAAARRLNDGVEVLDRGGYLRVSAPGRCVVTRAAIEAHLGRPVALPGDLEKVMTSFAGRLTVGPDGATWEAGGGGN